MHALRNLHKATCRCLEILLLLPGSKDRSPRWLEWFRDLAFGAASDEHVSGTCHGIHPRSSPLRGDRCSVGRWATGCLGLSVGWGKETTQGGARYWVQGADSQTTRLEGGGSPAWPARVWAWTLPVCRGMLALPLRGRPWRTEKTAQLIFELLSIYQFSHL